VSFFVPTLTYFFISLDGRGGCVLVLILCVFLLIEKLLYSFLVVGAPLVAGVQYGFKARRMMASSSFPFLFGHLDAM
jgi:hypothetical protein